MIESDSADFQFLLTFHSRLPPAFCTKLLYEFNILLMGLSVGCQVSSRLVESLFPELKVKFFFNFMEDLFIYVIP